MVLRAMDSDALRFLERHETRAHAVPGREIRDLGDALLLHDPNDPEPFWNRVASMTWPVNGRAFDRRLDEVITLFATLGRLPHVWPRPAFNAPPDLVDRLVAAGFEDMGHGGLMVLEDPEAVVAVPKPSPSVELIRIPPGAGGESRAFGREFALVLAEAFEVEPDRRPSIEGATLDQLDVDEFRLYLARVDGEPAAVAKRATFDGATYLASIGTRPAFRGRGLGALVTAAATMDAIRAGSRWVHLGVFSDNVTAVGLYERLGFRTVGEPVPDLLLRR
jgi:ribosomal protein S18 acetylase RimI-like enzyme